MDRKKMRSNVMLALTAFIWGLAFVAQSVGMDYVGPFTFNAVRFLIGGLVLIPCMFLLRRGRHRQEENEREENRQEENCQEENCQEEKECACLAGRNVKRTGEKQQQKRNGVIGGICCGIALFMASSFQQFGVALTSVGKAGFITALYIIIVPLLGLFVKKKVGLTVWASVAIAMAGMYLLCMSGGAASVSRGDLYVFIGSICFSFHILIIDYFSPKADGVFLSCIQFFTAGILALGPSLVLETPAVTAVLAAWAPVLYAGVMSCGVAYTLQVVVQKDTDPVVASLILSLESVFSLLAGWVILGQRLSIKELSGCVLVFGAILLAQLPENLFSRKESKETASTNGR